MFIGRPDFEGFKTLLSFLFDEILADIDSKGVLQFELGEADEIAIKITAGQVGKTQLRLKNLDAADNGSPLALGVLVGVCEGLRIEAASGHEVTILSAKNGAFNLSTQASALKTEGLRFVFRLDVEIFRQITLNYGHLNDELRRYAYLNPELKIVSICRKGLYQRNVFSFKNGVADQLDEIIASRPYPHPTSRLDLKSTIDGYTYQVSFCHLSMYFSKSYIRSFANNQEAYLGGSLVDGILLGMMDAIKRRAALQNIGVRITRSKLTEGLVLIAAVKGPEMVFRGSTKWRLYMPKIKKDIRLYIDKQLTAFIEANPLEGDSLIHAFKTYSDEG